MKVRGKQAKVLNGARVNRRYLVGSDGRSILKKIDWQLACAWEKLMTHQLYIFQRMKRWSGLGLLLGCCWLLGTPTGLAQEEGVELSQQENQQINNLINQLGNPDSNVRNEAAESLVRIGEAAVDPLITSLQAPYPDVRQGAVWALGEIGLEAAADTSSSALQDPDAVVDSLIIAFQDPDADVRQKTIQALVSIGSGAQVFSITTFQDSDAYLSFRALWALEQIGEESFDPLITALQDPDAEVRQRTAGALGQIGSEAAVDPLITALQDSDAEVRQRTAGALGQIGSEAAVDPLINALQDPDEDVRFRAFWALSQIGSETVISPLLAVLEDSDTDFRQMVGVLIEIGEIFPGTTLLRLSGPLEENFFESSVDSLITDLQNPDAGIRLRAVSTLELL